MALHGVGVDICAISRIKTLLEKHGDKFIARVLVPHERPAKITPAFLAKRYAAKEAVAKALGTGIGGQLSFHHIAITRTATARPRVVLVGQGAKKFPRVKIHVSLSDDAGFALAFAIAEIRNMR